VSLRKELTLFLPLLCLLVLLPFWRIATGQGLVITNDLAISDMANLQHPLRHFVGQELRQGRLPLWAPGIYMGFPLLAEGQAGLFYPPNLLLFGLLPVGLALNISLLLPFVVAATGAYLLARELGAGVAGALLAGVAYALSGFYVVHVKHMPMVEAASWIPVVLWLVERGVRRSEGALLAAGLVIGMQWLAGAPQIPYYTAGVATLYFAGRTWQLRRERSPRRSILIFALALFLSVGVGAVQLLPTFELVGFSERAGGVSFEFASRFPYALDNLKTFLFPAANGDPGTGDLAVSSIFWEDYAYMGLVPLLLGLFGGLALARRSSVARLLLGLTLLTFLLALGSNTPLYRLAFQLVPGMGFFRFPQRFFAFTVLFLAVLAALALTHFQAWWAERVGNGRRRKGKRRRAKDSGQQPTDGKRLWPRLVAGILLALVVVDLYAYHIPWNAFVEADVWLEPPATAHAVQERAGSGLYRVFTHDVFNTFRAAYRQAGGWRGDLAPYVAQREFLQPSLNLIYDVPVADGYVNLVPDCLVALWGSEKQLGLMDRALAKAGDRLTVRPGFMQLLGLYNVRFLITSQPVEEEALELVGVFGRGAHLYENRQTIPRAFVVPDYTVTSDVAAALELMGSSSFVPAQTVVLLESPDVPASPVEGLDGTVNVVTYEPTRVEIEAELSGPGWLVLSDTYYPGWEATVDGRPAPIYQANGCVRAVPLAEGAHQVVFRFRPRSFAQGALISGVSVLLFVAAWLALYHSASSRNS
jgi:hypothetical protein